jgi:hypothetical protein
MNWIPEDPTFMMDDVPYKLRPFIYVLLHGPRKLGVEHFSQIVPRTLGESRAPCNETRRGKLDGADSTAVQNG